MLMDILKFAVMRVKFSTVLHCPGPKGILLKKSGLPFTALFVFLGKLRRNPTCPRRVPHRLCNLLNSGVNAGFHGYSHALKQ
jgi:hypothetical protein